MAFLGVFTISFSGCGCRQQPLPPTELTIWGVWDGPDFYDEAFKEFKDLYPNVKQIDYKKFAYDEYLTDLTEALAAGKGPDIFMIDHTWVPAHKDKMLPLNEINLSLEEEKKDKLMTVREYKETFVPAAAQDLIYTKADGTELIYSMPLWNDNLAVYYNKDLFKKAGLTPPPKNWTWDDFATNYVPALTEIDEYNNVKKAGVAIGYGKNVYRSSDIWAAIMMQMGSEMVNEDYTATFNREVRGTDANGKDVIFSPGKRALTFYTSFADPSQRNYCWSPEMHYSIDEFYEGDAGMLITYSHHIETIKAKAPRLDFGIAYLPQIKGSSKPVNNASYWAMAVSKQTKGQASIDAWKFLKFITDKERSQQYSELTQQVSPRLDLLDKQKEDQWLGVFADQAFNSTSWKQYDDKKVAAILERAINTVVEGEKTPGEAASAAAQQISQGGQMLFKKLRDGS